MLQVVCFSDTIDEWLPPVGCFSCSVSQLQSCRFAPGSTQDMHGCVQLAKFCVSWRASQHLLKTLAWHLVCLLVSEQCSY
mmetsp:Transcript_41561/g.70070  ORF Transcript_41561/g.70070 Transcript_41561/m.70070 type:complete len:80 (+) Transcript_41561:2909-3148(+)